MNMAEDIIQALLETETSDFGSVQEEERRQGEHCLELLQCLRHQLKVDQDVLRRRRHHQDDDSRSNTTTTTTNIRSLLGGQNVTSITVSKLTRILAQLMSSRVDAQELMPLTYDDEANQKAMNESAITLTRFAMVAAELYAQLLGIPGAQGVGMVDLEALQGLAAVVERWATECRGKEKDAVMEPVSKGKRRTNQVDRSQDAAFMPTKRKRNSSPHSSDSNDASEDEAELVVEETGATLTPPQLLTRGLQVASQAALIPSLPDFLAWSEEAREVTITTVVTALSTSSTLLAPGRGKKVNSSLQDMAETVVSRSSTSLVECVPSATSEALDSGTMTKRVHATTAILKGLMPLLLFQRDVPMGAKGKQEAAEAASNVLVKFIARITQDIDKKPNSWPKSPFDHSPAAATTPTTPATTLQTPKTANKSRRTPLSRKRLSTGGGKPITPLKLKSATKTPRTLSPASQTAATQARPVIREIIALLHRLVFDPALETASVRNHCIETLHRCIPRLPSFERWQFVQFFGKLTQSRWWYCRQVGCELSVRVLLQESWFWNCNSSSSHPTKKTPGISSSPGFHNVGLEEVSESLVKGLVDRLEDKERGIRMCCANGLTSLFQSLRSDTASSVGNSMLLDTLAKQASNIADVLRECCLNEDKALAKKSLIGALVLLLVTGQEIQELDLVISEEDTDIFRSFCQDSSPETRKAAAEALTTMLEAHLRHDNPSTDDGMLTVLETSWTKSVLPLALENDSRLVSNVLTQFDRIVFDPIVGESDNNDEGGRRSLTAWRVVADAAIQSEGIDALRILLQKKLNESQSRDVILRPLISNIVEVACAASLDVDPSDPTLQAQRDGVWCLFKASLAATNTLSEFTRMLKKNRLGLGFVVDCWNKIVAALSSSNFVGADGLLRSLGQCLEVITVLAPQLDDTLATAAADSIYEHLTSFGLPTAIIGVAISALNALTISLSDSKDPRDVQQKCITKIRALFKVCQEAIAASIGVEVADDSESRLVRALFTTGELCLVGFSEDEGGAASGKDTKCKSDPTVGILEHPPAMLFQLVQTFLASTLPKLERIKTPSVIRSIAFLTLGKMCIRNEALTVKSVTLFARELHEAGNGSPVVQANALVVLGDLCVRYANQVDRFLPIMATCLQSSVSGRGSGFDLVREQAVHLLSNLIMQDYIKWRGLLLHRFLVATADEEERVACVAQKTLCGPLLNKKPKLFAQNFVESLFVLNRCTTHPIYKAASMSGDGGSGAAVDFKGINLDGSLGSARRHQIYKMMLSKMSDEQKISVTARIAKDVLGNALEQDNDLHQLCNFSNPEGLDLENHPCYARSFNVLRDALTVLRSKMIRVSRRKDEEASSTTTKQMKVDAIKGELLSNINRTQLVEIMVPILLNLKTTLQKNRSPLLKDLMGYLLVVYETYPDKIKDALSNEPQILMEIEHDARVARRSKQTLIPVDDSSSQ